MGEVIWVEVLSRHRDVAARYRCSGTEIHIGRGYDNDVVIDDPYIAPRHIRIARNSEGVLVAADLGTANGLFADKSHDRKNRIVINGDAPIRIGRTYLRIRDEKYAVAPERIVKLPGRRSWLSVLYLALPLLVMQALSAWLGETVEQRLSHYIFPVLGIALITLGWTTLWAILSRVFSGHANFEANLVIALKGMLIFVIGDVLVDYAAFSLSWGAMLGYVYIGAWLLLATICFFHVREIGPSRLPLKGSIVAALAIAAISTQSLVQSENHVGTYHQNYVRRLKPPAFRLAPEKTDDAFFSEVEQLRAKLDRSRSEDSDADGTADVSDADD